VIFLRGALALLGLSPLKALMIGSIVLAGLAFVGGVWKSGYNYAQRACEAAALRSKIEAMQTDMRAATEAAASADRARAEIEATSAEDKKRIEQYEQELRKRPAAACTLGDDDLRWLRDGKSNRK
jgi:outer membrane murein-binding lipoprotein Lpp